MSIQFFWNKFVKIFNTSITNITKVDWDEIELTTNKLVVENNHIMHGHFSKSWRPYQFFRRKHRFHIKCHQTISSWCGKNGISLDFHMNPKTNYNQFSIHSLQLLKDEIRPYSIFSSMVHSLNEECVHFDDILYIYKKIQMNHYPYFRLEVQE